MTRVREPSTETFAAMLALLENLMPQGWFARQHPECSHPALVRWKLLRARIDGGGTLFPSPTDIDGLLVIAEMLLDGFLIINACGGDVGALSIGSFSNYGDAKVRRRISEVTKDPIGFASLLTELSRAAFHISQSHRVTPTEDPGLADLTVEVPEFALPLIMDCKRIAATSKVSRFSDAVRKANDQIRNHQKRCFGLAVVDITDRARSFIRYRTSHPRRIHHTPDEVREASEALQRALRGDENPYVHAAVIVWNEVSLRPITGNKFLLAANKRTKVVAHRGQGLARLPDRALEIIDSSGAGGVRMTVSYFE